MTRGMRMILKLVAITGMACVLFASSVWTAQRESAIEAVATLLLDGRPLCADLALGRGMAQPRVRAVRRALGRETLEIAGEILDSVGARTADVRTLERALRLQRRLCLGPPAKGETHALMAEVEAVRPRLEAMAPGPGRERVKILDRFLDRREEAVLAAIRDLRDTGFVGEPPVTEEAGPADGTIIRSGGRPENVAPSMLARRSQPRTDGTVVESRNGEGGASRERQQWDPDPGEISRRQRSRQRSLEARISAWRPRLARELGPVLAIRARLARQLEAHSLEQLRSVCGRLGEAAGAVDYDLILASPVRAARSDLDRMLAGYTAAARWCEKERFSFAWMEITDADERWRRVSSLLGLLDR